MYGCWKTCWLHIYIYIYIYIYIHTHIYTFMYIYVCICIYNYSLQALYFILLAFCIYIYIYGGCLMTQRVMPLSISLPAMWETWVWSLGREDPLEKELANHSSILAWKIPWMEEPGRLQAIGSQRVRKNWGTSLYIHICMTYILRENNGLLHNEFLLKSFASGL